MYARYLQRVPRLPWRAFMVPAARAALAAAAGALAAGASAEDTSVTFPD